MSAVFPLNTAVLYFSPRLHQALEGIFSRPLTLIEAPMGYGKTVAARDVLGKREIRLVWTSVLGNSEDAFWRDFCRALRRSFPQAQDTLESLLRLGYPRDAVRLDAARELLLQLDFASGPETVLVADDIHLLPPSGGHGLAGLCALLARQGVEHLRMVLISRDVWRGEREILKLKGRLGVVGREAFALNEEEIRAYYALCGLRLSPEEARALHAATEGWISALYLYLLHYSEDGALSRPTAMNALVEKEIFSRLTEDAKDLLLRLAPLERFSAPQASFLRGTDATALLAELRARNAFINYDEADESYALHSIFRQYLQERFDGLPEERRRAIHRGCADWFVGREEACPAVDAFYAAGDDESALAVLESEISRNLVHEESRFFYPLFQRCPDDLLVRHMGAAFQHAIAVFMGGDFAAFGARLAWIGAQCAAMPENDPQADAWRGELEFLLSLAAYNDIAAMSAHHRRANALLGRPTSLFGPESPWTLGCPSVLFMFHRQPGQLAEEVRLMHECMPHYYTLAAGHGAGGEHLMEAEALYNAGALDDAAIACHRAEAQAKAHGQLGNVFCAMFLRQRLALFSGDFPTARELTETMREMISARRDYFLLHTVDLCKGFLHAIPQGLEQVPDWLRAGQEEEKRLYTFAGGFYYLVHGRILLLSGRHAQCLGLFAWLLDSGVFDRHLLFNLHARLCIAVASAALGKADEARAALETALDMALPDKLYMPFVENWDLLKPVFRLLPDAYGAPDADARRGREGILALAAIWEKNQRRMLAEHFPAEGPALTRRELDLARLAATGKTYLEIARELNLAPSTVKKAFSLLLRKLGLSSRRELPALLARRGLSGHDRHFAGKKRP